MAFNRDPRLFPIEPSYPQGEIALLIKEKKELKKQADELYIYKEHLKKELEKSKQASAQMSIELENAIAENTKNIEKMKEAEKSADYHSNKYRSLKRKFDDEINEIEISADKKYNNLDDNYNDLMLDYKTLSANYDDLKKEFEFINYKKMNHKMNYKTVHINARLCYHYKTCYADKCLFAHSIDDLRICPDGEKCSKQFCAYLLHSEINRMLFCEYYRGKDEALCRDYELYDDCINSNCSKIHYDFKTMKKF